MNAGPGGDDDDRAKGRSALAIEQALDHAYPARRCELYESEHDRQQKRRQQPQADPGERPLLGRLVGIHAC